MSRVGRLNEKRADLATGPLAAWRAPTRKFPPRPWDRALASPSTTARPRGLSVPATSSTSVHTSLKTGWPLSWGHPARQIAPTSRGGARLGGPGGLGGLPLALSDSKSTEIRSVATMAHVPGGNAAALLQTVMPLCRTAAACRGRPAELLTASGKFGTSRRGGAGGSLGLGDFNAQIQCHLGPPSELEPQAANVSSAFVEPK